MVAKGYSQEHGVDYTKVFVLVARLDTIRVVISLAALKEWTIYQLDIKSAFLHSELSESLLNSLLAMNKRAMSRRCID